MTFTPIEDVQTALAELARRVESGDTISVTRDGKPALDLVEHRGAECGGRLGLLPSRGLQAGPGPA